MKENVRRQWRTHLCCGRLRLLQSSGGDLNVSGASLIPLAMILRTSGRGHMISSRPRCRNLQPCKKCPVHVCAEWSGTRSHRNTPAAASAASWPPRFPSRSSSVISDGTSNGGTFTSSLQAPSAPKHFSARVLLPRRFGVCGQRNIRLLQQRRGPQRDPQKPGLETPKCCLLLFKSHY